MIVPWIKGFLLWQKAPVTWMLLALNLFIFLGTWESQKPLSPEYSTAENLILTGKLYAQFQDPSLKSLPARSRQQWMIQGGQGLKDPRFMENATSYLFFGDQLAIDQWRQVMRQYRDQVSEKWTTVFGLRTQGSSPLNWITYQFMHASPFHLLGNMLMFLIFGAALESLIGGLGLCMAYIGSGLAGAWLFMMLSPASLAPMVGASGALSGIMALFASFEKKKRVSFFYFVSPLPGYYGWIYLPTLFIFPLCFLPDLVGYLSTPAEIGAGVAYTAHMGGMLLGVAVGLSLRYFRKNIWVRWFVQH